jgi:hypothetical protein
MLATVLALAAGGAHANAIIPYMVVPWGQLILLPLVVVVEAVILHRMLKGKFLPTLGQSFLVNLVSTLVGAGLYYLTMTAFGQTLYQWWFKGGFASEAIRNAAIALALAIGLGVFSWIVESRGLAYLRQLNSWEHVLVPCAVANATTYTALVVLAVAAQG